MQRHVLGHGFLRGCNANSGRQPTEDLPMRIHLMGTLWSALTFTHAIGCDDANFLPPISIEGFWKVVREPRFHNPKKGAERFLTAPEQNELPWF